VEEPQLSAAPRVFTSDQVGTSASAGDILSTDGDVSTWIPNTGGGGGTGSVATSTTDVDTHVTFFTSNSATPATIGGEAAFTYDDSTNLLTLDSFIANASSTVNALLNLNAVQWNLNDTTPSEKADVSSGSVESPRTNPNTFTNPLRLLSISSVVIPSV